MTDLSDLVADDSLGESESNDTIVSLVSEGRRLLDAAQAGDVQGYVIWVRNNLPALLDEVERLRAENADRDAYDRANLTAVAATVAHKDAEIARLREALRTIAAVNDPWTHDRDIARAALAVVEEPK